ncbi:uncharacterized protein LOC135708608 [Ochlerotatus camptorhynchus]|uniref:uncharacterized protein LOC135708608 n=1 Tax=Ochlerotatus camptorhynchus TaxID=644619 RepID=UPI0031DAD889
MSSSSFKHPSSIHKTCKTKAEMKQFTDAASCPIVPNESTKEKAKLRHSVGVFKGQKQRTYNKWRTRLLAHLDQLGLIFTLRRTPPEEEYFVEQDSSTREVMHRIRCERDCDAIEEICMSIEGEPLEKIAQCTYAKEVLDTLDRCYRVSAPQESN